MPLAVVTGATGFIGGRVTRALLGEGWDVAALVRTPAKAAALEQAGVRILPGDVTLPDTVEAAVKGADTVFHIAAWYQLGVRDRALMEAINVVGTETVLRAAANAGVSKIVYCSSVAALGRRASGTVGDESSVHDGSFASIYEETKHRAHGIAERYAGEGAPIVTVMPGGVYGPGDTSIMGLLLRLWGKRMLPVCPYQDASVSWVHVDDVAAGHLLAATKGRVGESYILAGDNETIGGMLRRAAPFVGRRPPLRMSDNLVRASLPMGPLVAKALKQAPDLMREGWSTLRGWWTFSSAKAERELGYRWRPIEEGIPPTVLSTTTG